MNSYLPRIQMRISARSVRVRLTGSLRLRLSSDGLWLRRTRLAAAGSGRRGLAQHAAQSTVALPA
jgi:hypothetical protein